MSQPLADSDGPSDIADAPVLIVGAGPTAYRNRPADGGRLLRYLETILLRGRS